MSEQNNLGIEETINTNLSGDTQKNALDFIAFLKANEMTVKGNSEVIYKDKPVCYLYVDGSGNAPGPWTVWPEGDYGEEHKDMPLDEHTKDIARAKVNFCASCGGNCSPGTSKVIFGKGFDKVCGSAMAFTNPDEADLECLKKLLEMRKLIIAEMA